MEDDLDHGAPTFEHRWQHTADQHDAAVFGHTGLSVDVVDLSVSEAIGADIEALGVSAAIGA